MIIDILTENARHEVPEAMMFAHDVAMCGANEVDMTENEYLESWRKTLEEMK